MSLKKIFLVTPRGFCAGVVRAIEIVEKALQKYGPPVYVRHEIVHNKHVIENLKQKGAIFVKQTSDIPTGAIAIFSAHGVSRFVENEAKSLNLDVIDATCPLVTKVHIEAKNWESAGKQIIMIGHPGHPEVEGTTGRVHQHVQVISSVDDVAKLKITDPSNLAYVTQTTLSVDETKAIIIALQSKFPLIQGPNTKDICFATQNRQDAVRKLANLAELVFVVGAKNSSNSNRLFDLAKSLTKEAFLIDDAAGLDIKIIENFETIGITAGASAPEILVQGVIEKICKYYNCTVEEIEGAPEKITFKIPARLQ